VIEARRALLDVLEALGDNRESVVISGAQAVQSFLAIRLSS